MVNMQIFEFTLVMNREMTAEKLHNRLDDMTIGVLAGIPIADVDREANSFEEAVESAIRDIESIENFNVLMIIGNGEARCRIEYLPVIDGRISKTSYKTEKEALSVAKPFHFFQMLRVLK
jgi:hypothetical protein